ncbi:MAG: sigma-70 family RNA polymerase sigma factor [Eubacterium sp.]|nr:sigma-70 family RNA polymerase sigma factor [Eubacterium sp.]
MEMTMDENKIIHYDVDAFCQIYEQYKERLYRYAFYRLGNAQDAEDAVSECVLSAYRQIRQLRDAKAFPAWIFKILSAVCAKLISQQAECRKTVSLDAASSPDRIEAIALQSDRTGTVAGTASANAACLTMQDSAEKVALRLDLQHALEQLTAEEKEIVLLSLVAGFTSQEIAQMTGGRPGTVRSKQSRSLAKMRAYLEGRS